MVRRRDVTDADGVVVEFSGMGPSRDPIDPTVGALGTIAGPPTRCGVLRGNGMGAAGSATYRRGDTADVTEEWS